MDEETRKMQQLMGIGGFETTKVFCFILSINIIFISVELFHFTKNTLLNKNLKMLLKILNVMNGAMCFIFKPNQICAFAIFMCGFLRDRRKTFRNKFNNLKHCIFCKNKNEDVKLMLFTFMIVVQKRLS